jgi:hypothetical protein
LQSREKNNFSRRREERWWLVAGVAEVDDAAALSALGDLAQEELTSL